MCKAHRCGRHIDAEGWFHAGGICILFCETGSLYRIVRRAKGTEGLRGCPGFSEEHGLWAGVGDRWESFVVVLDGSEMVGFKICFEDGADRICCWADNRVCGAAVVASPGVRRSPFLRRCC